MAECKDCFHFEVCSYASHYLPVCDSFANDVAPVRHGRWECGKPCPVCGEDRFKGLDADIWADWEPPYCPNCGAKMDLVDDNDTL